MSFPHFNSDFIAVKISSHQTSAKPRSAKCRHFCFLFDTHNYCPTCRESGKGDDPCVTNQSPCNICANFCEEQQIKIKHRRRYVRKQKSLDPCNTSKDDDLDLMTWRRQSRLQKERRLEKSLGNQFNIQLKQQMGVFQSSMLEAMKSLRDEMHSMKKASEAEVDKTSASLSKAGPSNQPDPTLQSSNPTTRASDHSDAQPMDTEVYGPPLPPKFTQSVQSDHASKHSDLELDHHSDPHSEDHSKQPKRVCSKAKKHSESQTRKNTRLGQSTILSRLLQRKISPLFLSKNLLNLNKRLLLSLNIYRIAQTQFSTG